MIHSQDIEGLLSRVASGDRSAFRKLYGQTSAKLFGVALRILSDDQLAEEVVEEVFVALWDSAGQYRTEQTSALTWLLTLTRDTAVQKLRDAKDAGRAVAPLDITERLYAPKPELAAPQEEREEARVLRVCLRELPAGRAELLRQAYLFGASYAELSDRTGKSPEYLRSVLRSDLIRLRDCLSR